jgi:hypothetical protein
MKNAHYKATSVWIPIKRLCPYQYKVMEAIDGLLPSEQSTELERDITDRGILISLMVQERADKPGYYNVIDGNRRYHIAKYLHDRGDKRFLELRCDVLKDDYDAVSLEITALLTGMNRRSLTTAARHLMIVQYKNRVEELVEVYKTPNGYKLPSSMKKDLNSTEQLAEVIIEGIKKEGRVNQYVAKALGLKSHATVDNAAKTTQAVRFAINKGGNKGIVVKKEDKENVGKIMEELSNLPDGVGKRILKSDTKTLQDDYRRSTGLNVTPPPIRTITIKSEKYGNNWGSVSQAVRGEIMAAKRYDVTAVVQLKLWRKKSNA